jgi:hypothetical protein
LLPLLGLELLRECGSRTEVQFELRKYGGDVSDQSFRLILEIFEFKAPQTVLNVLKNWLNEGNQTASV